MALRYLRIFLQSETSSGIVLMIAAFLALCAKNSGLAPYYDALVAFAPSLQIWGESVTISLSFFVNDGLMALFFLVVGLELKREMQEGALAKPTQMLLPAIGALGGMVVPSLIYMAFNYDQPDLVRGWAIPAATDIAFSLGVLSLLGNRVPIALKIFLTSLAIFDDVGAIVIIALFYASHFSLEMLAAAGAVLIGLILLNRARVYHLAPYLFLGALLWYFTLLSGIHPTIAGVVLALTIPLKNKARPSPLKRLEHALLPGVSYVILPLFGFMNAGVALHNLAVPDLLHPATTGIMLGLFLGKQAGIFLCCAVFILLRLVALPAGSSWLQFYGICLLAGIGFTMSLFIGTLAFGGADVMNHVKLGVLAGSLLSALAGYGILRLPAR